MNNWLCNNLFVRRTPLGERLRQNTKAIEQNKTDRKKRKKVMVMVGREPKNVLMDKCLCNSLFLDEGN